MEFVTLAATVTDEIKHILYEMVEHSSIAPSTSDKRKVFSFTIGLKACAQQARNLIDNPTSLLPRLCRAATEFGGSPPYIEALIALIESTQIDANGDIFDPLVDALIENLHSSTHLLRRTSLRLLSLVYEKINGQPAEALITALSIEDTPLNLQSVRTVSMHVRKLAEQYGRASTNVFLQRAVPHYCFGLLTVKMSQIWDDAADAISRICEFKVGETIVCNLAFEWLRGSEMTPQLGVSSDAAEQQHGPLSVFDCSNLIRIETFIERYLSDMQRADQVVLDDFVSASQFMQLSTPGSISRALRVLSRVPQTAEKHSRQLVPFFLSWFTDSSSPILESDIEDEDLMDEHEVCTDQQEWTFKDRKDLLDLFSKFTNPGVLYRSQDVYDTMLGLLASGDIEVQKSALKGILKWKPRGVMPYQENLVNILEDARFREEIAVFVNTDEQDGVVQTADRPELMPILVRILYGKTVARGRASGRRAQAVKRKAVLQALSRFDRDIIREFVQVALGPFNNVEVFDGTQLIDDAISMDLRKQVGLINMMKDMLETLGNQVAFMVHKLTRALLYCQIKAARVLNSISFPSVKSQEQHRLSLLRTVRQVGLQVLKLLFRHCCPKELRHWVPTIFAELIGPRLRTLPIDTAQSVSGLLHLFAAWASSPSTVWFLVGYEECDGSILKNILGCLDVPSAKDEVKLFILEDILKSIIINCDAPNSPSYHGDRATESVAQRILGPNVDVVLQHVGGLLQKSPSKEVLGSAVQLISMIAPMVGGSVHAGGLIEISTFLLDQPSGRVSPKSKGDLLEIVRNFAPLCQLDKMEDLRNRLFRTISSLFGFFKDRANRIMLSEVLAALAARDLELREVADLCLDLNSFSINKVDEPDFERRLQAFSIINETRFVDFNAKQWRALVFNMLFYVKDGEELAIRTNASFALRRFIETQRFDISDCFAPSSEILKLVLLPALRNGVSESSELVRGEYLTIMAYLIRHNPHWTEVNDMSALLMNNDEEASFFSNILHIQQHRRLRALRRLASVAQQGHLRSVNVAHFFIPLVEHFVFNKADDDIAHNLSAESVITIGALAAVLEWPQFKAMFRRLAGYLTKKPDLKKTVIKLLGVCVDALSRAVETKARPVEAGVQSDLDNGVSAVGVVGNFKTTLASTIPREQKLCEDLLSNILPPLEVYLHDKDESTVSLRIPVAVSVAKVIKLLPPAQMKDCLPAVLTDVCNVLRSRAQESRDLTRKTLVEIVTILGATYFGFILKELRNALARGYQLHVLSFTVHAILVATSSIFKPGDLDYCLPQIVSVVMDDTFGATGLEKDAEEYISKMKEVKSSKSYDSMELVAKTVTTDHLSSLIRPLQALLENKLDLRMVRKVDELLRRIGVGLLRNEGIQDRRVLIFCYEVIQEVYKAGGITADRESRDAQRTKRFLVNMKSANKSASRGSTSSYNYKLVRFAFDVLRSVLRKYEDLRTPINLAGFVPIIGDAVLGSEEEVQISALRLLATIIKVPLKEFDTDAGIFVSECIKLIKGSPSTNTELAQAALKLVSAVLRERRKTDIKDKDVAFLLKRLKPDLDEPDRQGVTFNLLKAVMARKITIPEVYDVLDAVAAIMVTNQTPGARDLARGVYFQFIMEYPQTKDRFSKQMGFLVANLDYDHKEGRQSVMEAIHLLLSKVGDNLVQDIVVTFFLPLTMVIINDESVECREMAGALWKTLLERGDAERVQIFLTQLRTWLARSERPFLVRVALQCYSLYFETVDSMCEKEVALLQTRLTSILESRVKDFDSSEWELLFIALHCYAKICKAFPSLAFAGSCASLWSCIHQLLWFPHAWVKLTAARLCGLYFADFARSNADVEKPALPLKSSGGLLLGEDEMIQCAKASLAALKVPGIIEELATQSVRNLVFLGRTMTTTCVQWPRTVSSNSAEDDDDEDIDETESTKSSRKTALHFILERSSAIIRRGPLSTKAPALIPLTAALQLLSVLCNHMSASDIILAAQTILLPLHNLTDPSIPPPYSSDETFQTNYKTLVSNCQETMSLLQTKLGTTEYIAALSRVREGVKERREGRRVKRRIEAVAEPEKAGKYKKRKGERKREKRKERSGEERGKRRGW